MNRVFFLVAIAFSLFIACNSTSNSKGTGDSLKFEKTTTTPFTDTVKLDSFNVSWQGTTTKGSAIVFKIISYKGEEIYHTSINADELLKANENLKTEADKVNFLKNEVAYFFDEEHFLWPAVLPTEKPDKNVPDNVFYEELKHTQLNGFNYRLGREAKVYIAWSAKENKVKIYYLLK
ncbi:hypothetical protein WG904_18885 [Pedobacter sp. Du54]|uniref:hypothetical protein n=1 Tax=Pedobacter anseongensis TaxID=3133439 RepID=UPI00309E8E0D